MKATSISASQLSADIKGRTPPIVIDVRRRPAFSASREMISGALRRDPDRVQEWAGDLSKSEPVVTYCAYGFHVGCKTAIKLREAGFDAKYMNSGHSGWRAVGGPLKLLP